MYVDPEIVDFCEKANLSKLYYCYLKLYENDALNPNEVSGYWGFEPVNGNPTIVWYAKSEKYGYIRHECNDYYRNCTVSTKIYDKKLIAIIDWEDRFEHGLAFESSGPGFVKNEIKLKYRSNKLKNIHCKLYITQFNEGKVIYNDALEDMVYGDVFKNQSTDFEKTGGGCYIATCVYGSYDCSQVWTLRRYRDYTLDKTWYGRLFIKWYYAVSPKLVKWFGNYAWFRKPWKRFLDNMVARLNSKGIADTKYNDKY